MILTIKSAVGAGGGGGGTYFLSENTSTQLQYFQFMQKIVKT